MTKTLTTPFLEADREDFFNHVADQVEYEGNHARKDATEYMRGPENFITQRSCDEEFRDMLGNVESIKPTPKGLIEIYVETVKDMAPHIAWAFADPNVSSYVAIPLHEVADYVDQALTERDGLKE